MIDKILDRIEAHALKAGAKAREACIKSKYSIQDYWMCIEFSFSRLHDDIARENGLSRRCKQSVFRKAVAEFRRSIISAQDAMVGREQQPTEQRAVMPAGNCGSEL